MEMLFFSLLFVCRTHLKLLLCTSRSSKVYLLWKQHTLWQTHTRKTASSIRSDWDSDLHRHSWSEAVKPSANRLQGLPAERRQQAPADLLACTVADGTECTTPKGSQCFSYATVNACVFTVLMESLWHQRLHWSWIQITRKLTLGLFSTVYMQPRQLCQMWMLLCVLLTLMSSYCFCTTPSRYIKGFSWTLASEVTDVC